MKTAVEWYCEKSIDILEELRAGKMTFDKWFKEQAVILKQAKEMEKEQSIELIRQTAMFMAAADFDEDIAKMTFEDIYETLKKQEQ
jgi:hypothetical protein